jgi:hypothetical protein
MAFGLHIFKVVAIFNANFASVAAVAPAITITLIITAISFIQTALRLTRTTNFFVFVMAHSSRCTRQAHKIVMVVSMIVVVGVVMIVVLIAPPSARPQETFFS